MNKEELMCNLLENFKCPKCNENIGIDVCIRCDAVIKTIISVEKDIIEYDDEDYIVLEPETDYYQCSNCGKILDDITSNDELIEYLQKLKGEKK